MSRKSVNGHYWQTPPLERGQIVLFQTSIEDRIPGDHPVRMRDEILDRLDWTDWKNTHDRGKGQPPIHPSVLCKALLFAMTQRIRSSRTIEYKLPAELADLKARRTQMDEVLELLKQMDARRKSEGKDTKENPAQLWVYETMVAPVLKEGVILGLNNQIRAKIGREPNWNWGVAAGGVPVQEIYSHVHSIIQMSETYENLPRVGFEAMASGCLLIVDDRGG